MSYLTWQLKTGKWFGFAEVDIEIPKPLHKKFEETCPFFFNSEVPEHAVPKEMLAYLKSTSRKRTKSKKLVAALSAKRILLYEPLLKWYLDHGAVLTKMHRTIDYEPKKIFTWFCRTAHRSPAHGKRRQKQSAARRHVQALGKQRLQQADRSGGAANERCLHERRKSRRPGLAQRLFHRSGKNWRRLRA